MFLLIAYAVILYCTLKNKTALRPVKYLSFSNLKRKNGYIYILINVYNRLLVKQPLTDVTIRSRITANNSFRLMISLAHNS